MSEVKLLLGDCLEVMKDIPDKSINLICTDPPYNIGKAEWDKIPNYIDWCGEWLVECQRVLADNGSFYFFHNDMQTIADLMIWIRENTQFVFSQFIVWNKKFNGYHNQIHAVISQEGIRNYPKIAEYCLFYTFQDETGLTTVMLDTNNFSTLRQYFKDYQEALGLNLHEINRLLGHRKAEHSFYWGTTQWDMPTEETYNELAKLPIHNEFVRREYEDLRREYEDLRYTFNNQKTHHSVWNYEIAKGNGHETPKPVEMIENIIRHSSNEGDLVLDLFMGSGTTGEACLKTNRRFIGIEKDAEYFAIAEKRIHDAQQQMRLEF